MQEAEAAWQIASRGVPVRLYEMRPVVKTPAHHTDKFAELVCSNSLRANGLTNAVGVLKEEMRMLNSLVLGAADRHAVPAGGALAVDRDGFSGEITSTLHQHPLIEVVNEEFTAYTRRWDRCYCNGATDLSALSEQIQGTNG